MVSIAWLEVPAEVRCKIYQEYFRSIEVEIHGNHRLVRKRKREKEYSNISILLTCRTVNLEADPYFLSESQFIIKDCHCWRKNPETRPRRLREIQYLTFETTASEDHWVSFWFELINPSNTATPMLSNIKELKISEVWSLDAFEDMLWIFDAIRGRFQHFALLVDLSGEEHGNPEEYCSIIIDQNHNVTVMGVEMMRLEEIRGVLLNDCATISDENMTLLLKGGDEDAEEDDEEEEEGDEANEDEAGEDGEGEGEED